MLEKEVENLKENLKISEHFFKRFKQRVNPPYSRKEKKDIEYLVLNAIENEYYSIYSLTKKNVFSENKIWEKRQ